VPGSNKHVTYLLPFLKRYTPLNGIMLTYLVSIFRNLTYLIIVFFRFNMFLMGFPYCKITIPLYQTVFPVLFLFNIRNSISYLLWLLFRRSLDEGVFPDLWKLCSVSLVYKSGVDSQVVNYRPISILSHDS